MSDIIRLLPDSVANQIAAGEVIQRPASVIKELVENAVDAGATDIRIYLKDAGRTLIQVVDNGKGMSDTDARMAFERHATSKIKDASDLFSLRTMGFRGEALPSICAVSQVELKTRTTDSQLGTRLLISGSRLDTQEPCACDVGSNFMIRNIFFNVPARRKFLKSDSVELSGIMREFERLALVNNNIRMSIDTGNKVIDLRPATFKQRITDIWKNSLNPQLLPVEVDTALVRISGFISRPEFARRRNPLQYLIVNGRNMRHPYFHKAIAGCYDQLIAADTQPCYFLRFEVDPTSIDVNIHPTKSEIKFENESGIWPILQAAVKSALGKFGAVPSIDFNSDVLPMEPLKDDELPEIPTLDIPDGYNPFDTQTMKTASMPELTDSGGSYNPFAGSPGRGGGASCARHPEQSAPADWESLYDSFMRESSTLSKRHMMETFGEQPEFVVKSASTTASEKDGVLPEMESSSLGAVTVCLQHASRYIVTSMRDGLVVIDQHRAHVRVLYEEYLERVSHGANASQGVMFPETLSLDVSQMAALKEVEKELASLGFVLEYEDGDSWRLVSVPACLKNVKASDIVLKILDSVTEDSVNYGKDGDARGDILSRMALVMARSAAIERGRKLSLEEMESLVARLFMLPDPAYTPNGNRIYAIVDESSLRTLFG